MFLTQISIRPISQTDIKKYVFKNNFKSTKIRYKQVKEREKKRKICPPPSMTILKIYYVKHAKSL